jgi:hypothetical protein
VERPARRPDIFRHLRVPDYHHHAASLGLPLQYQPSRLLPDAFCPHRPRYCFCCWPSSALCTSRTCTILSSRKKPVASRVRY